MDSRCYAIQRKAKTTAALRATANPHTPARAGVAFLGSRSL
eukprot:SAG11_NODE_37898_length_254_cov_3.387097_1_plen_40_part_01